ncbi:MAG: hypothetical protein QXU97_04125 [Fervidicoccaceae archaeon]
MKGVWRSIPLHAVVLEMLSLKGGTALDRELYEAVRMAYDVSWSEFLRTLMRLELRGLIRVATAREGTLIVELVGRGGER